MARITCFDGANCIGGNKILLEDGCCKLFFDFGKNYSNEGRYYEEFLQPKNCSGIYEHIQMGLLPPFRDLYREDFISELANPWDGIDAEPIGDVEGVLVSHAHVDHIGSIHHLRTDIPIYCTPMTAAVSRALQDTGLGATVTEYCYYVNRVDDDETGLSTPHYKTHPAMSRKYMLSGPQPNEKFLAFWNNIPSSRALEPIELGEANSCGGKKVLNFPVDHSVYGASAWAVETNAGWIVYTGDLRLHGSHSNLTKRFAEEASKLQPVAMLIEGTRINSDSPHTEQSVKNASYEVVKNCKGLVVADFGPRNVERLISFLEIARDTGRRLAVLPKDAYLLNAMALVESEQKVPSINEAGLCIYWEHQSNSNQWRKKLREEYEHLIVTPKDVRDNQDKFICCFSFWDINELAYIKPVSGSIWIYSSCEAFNEEMKIDAKRLMEWLKKFDIKLVGKLIPEEQDENEFDDEFHVSGHASGKDLAAIVEIVRPKNLIPIHSTHPDQFLEKMGHICNILLPENGQPIDI